MDVPTMRRGAPTDHENFIHEPSKIIHAPLGPGPDSTAEVSCCGETALPPHHAEGVSGPPKVLPRRNASE